MENLEIKNNESGRSMIEMLGVLAIIGVLSVGGIAGYSKAMMKYRINKTIEQITLIAGNVRTFFAPQRSYAGLYGTGTTLSDYYDNKTVINIIKKAKLVPDEMIEVVSDEKMYVRNTFGNTFYISGNDSSFQFTTIVPQEACIEILSENWANANATGMSYIDASSESNITTDLPSDVGEAVTICDSACKNDICGIGLLFK